MLPPVSDAAERRRKRQADWHARVFRGSNVHAEMEQDALDEWAALSSLERLALVWELSLAQYGGPDAESMEPRLPRSAYRIERR